MATNSAIPNATLLSLDGAFRALAENAPVLLWLANEHGEPFFFNLRYAARWWGDSRERDALLRHCTTERPATGLAVVIPGRNEALERIASVLQRNGLVSDMHVPANMSLPWRVAKSTIGADRPPVQWLEKWAYRTPARTSAPLAEVLSMLALRVPGSQRYKDALVSWRNGQTDYAAARAVARCRAAGTLINIGWPSNSLETARRMAGPAVVYAAMDIWGVNRSLVREAFSGPSGASRREALCERNLAFEERATQAIVRATHIVVQSEHMVRRIREVWGIDPPTVRLGQGVDLPAQMVARDQASRPLRVLTVARVGYAKGIHYLADGVRCAGEAVDVALVAGGGSNEFPSLRRHCAGLQFLGQLPFAKVKRLYVEADVFVLPTLADSMARAVLEAMAAGLPVIITRESGYEDIIEDGVQGFFVPSRDGKAIAEKLAILARDGCLRARMGCAARELANKFSWAAFEDAVRTRLVPVIAASIPTDGGNAGAQPSDLRGWP